MIVRVKKAKERAAAAAKAVVGEISLLGDFSQGSSNGSPLPRRKKRARREHEVLDDDNNNNDEGGGEYVGYARGGGGSGGKKGANWAV